MLVQEEMDAAYPSPCPGQASSPQVLTECNLPLVTGLMSLPLVPCGWLEAYFTAFSYTVKVSQVVSQHFPLSGAAIPSMRDWCGLALRRQQQQLCHARVLPAYLPPVRAVVTCSGSRLRSSPQPGQHGKEVPVTGASWSWSSCWTSRHP